MKSQRFIFLDGLRGIAALAVMTGHITDGTSNFVFQSSTLAVDLFFCLSGFVIAWSYSDRISSGMSFREYFSKRLIRLYPMFLIGLSLGALLYAIKYLAHVPPYSGEYAFKSLLLNSLYIPILSYDPTYRHISVFPLNGPSWSLFFELVANIAFFWTVTLPRKHLIWLTACIGAALVAYTFLINSSPGWNPTKFYGGFFRVGYTFFMGVIMYRFFFESKKTFDPSALLIAVILAMLLLVPNGQSWWKIYWLTGALWLVPILVCTSTRVVIASPKTSKIMEYIGWLSYPIYCIHVPLIGLAFFFVPAIKGNAPLSLLTMVIIISIGHLMSKYADEPIRKWLSTIFKDRFALKTTP